MKVKIRFDPKEQPILDFVEKTDCLSGHMLSFIMVPQVFCLAIFIYMFCLFYVSVKQ